MTASKTLCSSDKNGYYMSISKDTYSVIESNYTLTIYDYDEGTTAGTITPATENNYNLLFSLFTELKKLETDFNTLLDIFKNKCSENNLYISVC